MGAKNRTPDHSLDETLVERVWRFSFFQLVRLLERHAKSAARVGGRGPASDEAVRLRPEASLGFPASDVTGLSLIRAPNVIRFVAAEPDTRRSLAGLLNALRRFNIQAHSTNASMARRLAATTILRRPLSHFASPVFPRQQGIQS